MRVMVIVKANKQSEAGEMPEQSFFAEMAKFNEELINAGMILAAEGLHASSKGVRVKFTGKDTAVIKGPFGATDELVAGFWLWKVKSMDDAIEWVKRSPFRDTEIEIRPILEAEDFGDNFTPELREQEERLRARSADPSRK
jgi:hypothetical protein